MENLYMIQEHLVGKG